MASSSELRTILIVDDEERLRRALERSLRQENRRTYSAASGEEAEDLLREKKVDLVITDLVMPGMDGMALVRSIKSSDPGVKIIIITAYGSAESMAEAQALGVACYLAKPCDLSDLKSKVNELLPAGGPGQPACAHPGSPRGPGALRFVCSGAGKTVGAVAGASGRALQYIKPRNIMLAAGRVTGAVTGVCLGIQEFASVLRKRS